MPKNITISKEADRDLKEIFKYTLLNWGENLAESYLNKIYQSICTISDYPKSGKPRDKLFLGCRILRSEKHLIFYQLKNLKIEIVRILHKNSNYQNHLGF